ncbi:hypothetical protein KDL01_17205 [Actinospica durhamensis]|uniref:Uncharacterized protein n=1 Tax=Actinospica durhamensis TaxID=1508375 RepID=A0A941IU26_9ACTN|nr:hypothetical protein [Actinospica durhamensis]MBR7835016.1 hypothetical protein [Actinospica durhamensis]
MSWDVVLFKIPNDVASMADIPRNYKPAPLGSRTEVEAVLRTAVPTVDLSDPTWGNLDGPTWSIELNIGRDDPIDSIMLHVRGGGDEVMAPIFAMAAALDCRVLDCSSGDFITAVEETDGWHEFQAFRDRAVWASGGLAE